jgi:hypothetical protein
MSPEYRISSLEFDVRRCKSEIEALKDHCRSEIGLCRSEIKAVEDRARERRDYWLSATFWTLCGLGAFGYLLLILEAILKARSN